MANQLIQVPAGLLLSPALSAQAKLVWMAMALGERGRPGRLSAGTGLARNTVARALTELKTASVVGTVYGGLPPGAGAAVARVPGALLTDRLLKPRARLLYACLQLLPGFSHPCGWFTYPELAAMVRSDPKTIKAAVAELAAAEWLWVEQAHRLARVYFELTFPGREQALDALAIAEWRVENARYHGEGLMREYLTLLVDSNEFEDNAEPGWLVNPETWALLQLDRFYPPQVAFEFNGVQHYRETDRFKVAEVEAQRQRDCWKLGICASRGVKLVVVHPEDLTLERMRQKVGSLLPLRNLDQDGFVIGYLEDESERYRGKVAHI